ncbi:conserved protein of unknown function [Pseudodesulfovibrio profundus]|uniref:DUF2867 domain-containing protein n=2 Tax=Pseudodesulfovibrio profundus TaxID=57320 RepID=A0A2C8F3E2_9BACT|nr:conserved protein of unknown function [Pseudodesulfovibrio profundus]
MDRAPFFIAMNQTKIKDHPELLNLYTGADYTESKSTESTNTLRRFMVGFLFYSPRWLTYLFRLRSVVAKVLRIDDVKFDTKPQDEESICFAPGDKCSVFTVLHGKEDDYLALRYEANHLRADILTMMTPLPNGMNHFEIDTIVNYKHWTGRFYFFLVRPFHHLIFSRMIHAGKTR